MNYLTKLDLYVDIVLILYCVLCKVFLVWKDSKKFRYLKRHNKYFWNNWLIKSKIAIVKKINITLMISEITERKKIKSAFWG